MGEAMQIPVDYLRNVPGDMERSDGKKRDARKVQSLLRALGRAESNMTSMRSLQRDMEEYAEDRDAAYEASVNMIADYLDCFTRSGSTRLRPPRRSCLRKKFNAETGSSPSFLCVICGMSNAAFRRPDGVIVVPITSLGT